MPSIFLKLLNVLRHSLIVKDMQVSKGFLFERKIISVIDNNTLICMDSQKKNLKRKISSRNLPHIADFRLKCCILKDKGKPMLCNGYIRRPFRKALNQSGCPKRRFHDLRHTYIVQGENVKFIQTQLGHATSMITLNVCSHLMKPENQAAVLRLENAVFSESGQEMVTNTGL